MADNAEKTAKKQTQKPEKEKRPLLSYADDKLNIVCAVIAAVLALADAFDNPPQPEPETEPEPGDGDTGEDKP